MSRPQVLGLLFGERGEAVRVARPAAAEQVLQSHFDIEHFEHKRALHLGVVVALDVYAAAFGKLSSYLLSQQNQKQTKPITKISRLSI